MKRNRTGRCLRFCRRGDLQPLKRSRPLCSVSRLRHAPPLLPIRKQELFLLTQTGRDFVHIGQAHDIAGQHQRPQSLIWYRTRLLRSHCQQRRFGVPLLIFEKCLQFVRRHIMHGSKEFTLPGACGCVLHLRRRARLGLLDQGFDLAVAENLDSTLVARGVAQAVKRPVLDRAQNRLILRTSSPCFPRFSPTYRKLLLYFF
jgi:hypothetical protein